MKIVLIIAIIVLAGFGITAFLVVRHAFNQVTRMKRVTHEEYFQRMEEKGLYSKAQFDQLDKEEIELISHDGYKLRGYYVNSHPDSNRVIVLVHGYTAAYSWMLQFVDMYDRLGFNVLFFDHRSHGTSEGEFATYGYHEKHDLSAWIDWVIERKGENCVIGLHGQSMGGGTVLEYAGMKRHEKQIKFIIADCPYSDLSKLMEHQLHGLNSVPRYPFYMWIERFTYVRAGFSFRDISPIRAISDSSIPIFFIHGDADTFVPTYMSEEMFKAKRKGKNKLLLIKGAAHAVAYGKDPDLYEREVTAFIGDVLEMN